MKTHTSLHIGFGAFIFVTVLTATPQAQRRGILPRIQGRGESRGRRGATETVQIAFQGMDRTYSIHVPGRLRLTDGPPAALVLAFHGGSQTAQQMEDMTGFSTLADRENFIVAYPQGVENSWADGRGSTTADTRHVDDVGFTGALIADIEKTHRIDPRRIYATGPSNGGILSNRLGCELADTLAAVGPVIGTIASNISPRCKPSRPIAVAGIQSVNDPLVPFAGGQVKENAHVGQGGSVDSARATQELWRAIDGCAAEPAVTTLPVRVNDGTSVSRRQFAGCKAGAVVVWY